MSERDSKFFNRELSWLEFNQRVLDEAHDQSIPLLERLKFLAITASNLDEFFMVRVGGLRVLVQQGISTPDPTGMTPTEQLAAISVRSHSMLLDQYTCFREELEPKLAEAGIKRVAASELTERQSKGLEQVFESEIFSVLSPIALASDRPFPLLANQMLHLCVALKGAAETPDEPRFAVIPLGRTIPRILTLSADRGYSYTLLEDVVQHFLQRFFPGEQLLGSCVFRITRNADFSFRDDLAPDMLTGMEGILTARKHGDCVRLEVGSCTSDTIVAYLKAQLEVEDEDIFVAPGPVDLSVFMPLTDRAGFDNLKYTPWPPQPSPDVEPGTSMFQQLSQRDILLVHPYQSFEPVLRLIEEAAADPDVLAIKQILYRTSRTSPIVAALAKAAQRGKYVTVIVELKARFDEARNIEWARNLEEAGVQVIFGVKKLKTHAKLCVIVRREPQGIQRYCHFGTGNYNELTAKIYSDVSLLTCNEELGADAVSFFNAITGYSQPQRFRKIEAAPIGLRARVLELIEGETKRKKEGQKASITAKVNSLVDPEIIQALYAASQAGVKVRLNVRGVCCLRPGVQGLSENITVNSVIDRFLEHARILHFHHGGDNLVFISSADWMTRNLDRRIELLAPVEEPSLSARLINVLETYFEDNVKSHELQPSGHYRKAKPSARRKQKRSQEMLYEEACKMVRKELQTQRTTFEPHRSVSDE